MTAAGYQAATIQDTWKKVAYVMNSVDVLTPNCTGENMDSLQHHSLKQVWYNFISPQKLIVHVLHRGI